MDVYIGDVVASAAISAASHNGREIYTHKEISCFGRHFGGISQRRRSPFGVGARCFGRHFGGISQHKRGRKDERSGCFGRHFGGISQLSDGHIASRVRCFGRHFGGISQLTPFFIRSRSMLLRPPFRRHLTTKARMMTRGSWVASAAISAASHNSTRSPVPRPTVASAAISAASHNNVTHIGNSITVASAAISAASHNARASRWKARPSLLRPPFRRHLTTSTLREAPAR